MRTLSILIAIAAAAFAIYEFVIFETKTGTQGDMNHLWLAIAGIVIALILGIVYFAGRVNKEEEIHITQ